MNHNLRLFIPFTIMSLVLISIMFVSCGSSSSNDSNLQKLHTQSVTERALECTEITPTEKEPQIFALVQKSPVQKKWDVTVSTPDKSVFFVECPGKIEQVKCISGKEGEGKWYSFNTYKAENTPGIFAKYAVYNNDAPRGHKEIEYSLYCKFKKISHPS